ncbi:hypothetical protein KUTeg_006594 [Tegillarca granosa]|uniref:Uncharacterized protein n=1 Tax=Tegillarca granosa TaxID=220873 RepID=A0ABQ9FAQ8_TEGGR|nr:hypothetical protein KUTeg_006594 [Tegillarca granosa]
MLQLKTMDLVVAVREPQIVTRILIDKYNDDSVWGELFDKVIAISNRHDVPVRKPRLYPFVDHLVSEISKRLIVPECRFKADVLFHLE